MTSKRNAKKVKESVTVKTEIVFPNDTNPMGILLGGRLVEWMDIAAAITAQNHAENICVTAQINNIKFEHSSQVGDIIHITAKITRAYNSSMEIIVIAESRKSVNSKKQQIAIGYFTYVAINKVGEATIVPKLMPITKLEKQLFNSALNRKFK